MKTRYASIAITVTLILSGLLMYYVYTKAGHDELPILNITPTPTQISRQEINIPAGWSTHQSSTLSLNISYPKDLMFNENEDGTIRLFKAGPTQKEGTEVYDGILLTISRGSHDTSTLKEYVDKVVAEKKADPIYTSVSSVEEYVLRDYGGYKFKESALGEFTNIYIPGTKNNHVHITYLVEDPKNQGFEKELNLILSTLVIRK